MQVEMSTPTMDFKNVKSLSTLDLKISLSYMGMSERVKVLPYNYLPRIIKKYPSAFIVNTENSFETGEHWIVLYFPFEGGLVEYFDSFGRAPSKKKFSTHVNEEKLYIHNHNIWLQNPLSSTCGYFCLLFIYFRVKLGFDEFPVKNDYDVIKFSEKLFPSMKGYK